MEKYAKNFKRSNYIPMQPHEMFASENSSTLESNIQGDAFGNSIEEKAYFEFENDLLLH